MERMMKMFTQTTPEDLAREGATVDWCRGGRKGVHAKFDNGLVVSIQWGPGNYCDNHDDLSHDAWERPAPPGEDIIEWVTKTVEMYEEMFPEPDDA